MISGKIESKIIPILELSLDERIYAYQRIWQSILDDIQQEEGLITEDEKKEIDRRLERIEKGEAKLFSWEEVKKELKANL